MPHPSLKWYKDDKLIKNDDSTYYIDSYHSYVLVIANITIEDTDGEYVCNGSNAFGYAIKIFKLKTASQIARTTDTFTTVSYILGAAFLIVVLYSLLQFRRVSRLSAKGAIYILRTPENVVIDPLLLNCTLPFTHRKCAQNSQT